MNHASLALLLVLATSGAAHAADEPNLLRLASCQDSWLDWKDDPVRMRRFGAGLEQRFVDKERGGAWEPKSATSLLGFGVAEVYPQSVGMGLGFSVVVNAPFMQVRQAYEKLLGKPLACQTSDGMRACELPLAENKTAMLMAGEKADSKSTLLGCYYYYEK